MGLRSMFNWKNAWRIRFVALSCLVILVGVGSQVLVNAFASGPSTMILKVTASSLEGRMADGNWAHSGACAVSLSQFALGTIIVLYNADGSFSRECTAEDTGSDIRYGNIALVMPNDEAAAMRWGTRYLAAQVVRLGWGRDRSSP